MATYDLEEQEKLDEFKAWWKRWGTWLLLGAALVVSAYAGWQYWQNQQQTHALEAASAYEKLSQALQSGDTKTAREIGTALRTQYADTAFAPRGAFLIAKLDMLDNQRKGAIDQLGWVAANTQEPALRDIAQLRLAAVLLDDKHYDRALKALAAPHGEGFKARFLDMKGDVLFKQGKLADASKAYAAAVDAMAADNPYRGMVEIKRDSTR